MSGTLVATIRREIQRALAALPATSVSVSAGYGLPPGGVAGTVLTKLSGLDGDADWESLPTDTPVLYFDEGEAVVEYGFLTLEIEGGTA